VNKLIGESHIQHKVDHKDFIQMHISEIKLLESLVKQADKFEKKAPIWNKYKMGLSASCSWTFFALGCVISIFFDDPAKLLTIRAFILYVLLFIGVAGIICCYHITQLECNLKVDAYDSPIKEIIDILQKLKEIK
jgi:hypothetical protein